MAKETVNDLAMKSFKLVFIGNLSLHGTLAKLNSFPLERLPHLALVIQIG